MRKLRDSKTKNMDELIFGLLRDLCGLIRADSGGNYGIIDRGVDCKGSICCRILISELTLILQYMGDPGPGRGVIHVMWRLWSW